ncbi:MAG: hypothetical protein ACPG7F_16755, partial [Aggregatilineales bacterium]
DSGGSVFTAFASDGVTCATGTYFTLVQTYIEGANHAHNTALRISVDGTSGGAIGAQGFIRNVDGHTETGMLVFRLVTLASSAKIGFTHQQIASWANTITMPADNSSMIILRLQE